MLWSSVLTHSSLICSNQQIWGTFCSIYTEDRQSIVWNSGYPSTSLYAVMIQEHTVFIFSMEVRPQIWRQQVHPNQPNPTMHITNRKAQYKLCRFFPYIMLWKNLLVLSLHNSMIWAKFLKLTMQSTVLLSHYYMQQISTKKLDINKCVKNNRHSKTKGNLRLCN